jgi:plasmid maintenance system antidote protein VapI
LEQLHVRVAMRFLKARAGGWHALAPALGFKAKTLTNVNEGARPSAKLAFRLARFAGASIDDLLAGKFPLPGACPYCGRT